MTDDRGESLGLDGATTAARQLQQGLGVIGRPSRPGPCSHGSQWRVDIMSSTIEKSVEVDVPVRVAYNQWTQFEEFPRFMQGIKEVRQVNEKKTHWVAEVGFKE